MSSTAGMRITVGSSRGASSLRISTNGRYISLATNDITIDAPRQPIQPTSTSKAFWLSILALATAQVEALPLPAPR